MKIDDYFDMTRFDDIHYNFSKIDGYNKPFNFIISGREPGKSTQLDCFKIMWPIFCGDPIVYFVRNATEISPELIESLEGVINKWTINPVKFIYKNSSFGKCCVDIYFNDKIAIRFISMTIKKNTIKRLVLKGIKYIVFDEFILDMSCGEKYITGEYSKFQEIYTTLKRERPGLKCYFCGNPYSLYNPYFEGLGIDASQLTYGEITTGDNWAVEYYKMSDKLREKILKENPFYKFDNDKFDDYTAYGVEGKPVNDANIPLLPSIPSNYSLYVIFKITGTYLAVWRASALIKTEFKYFICKTQAPKNRVAYCFDFTDLVEGTKILSYSDRLKFENIRRAMRERSIAFKDIACYYKFVDVYTFL